MRRTAIDFEMREFVPPSRPLGVSAEMASTSSLFLTAPPGWDKNLHPTPRKQLAVVLDGHVCITVSDGETIDLKPGNTFLLNDMARKGPLAAGSGRTGCVFSVHRP